MSNGSLSADGTGPHKPVPPTVGYKRPPVESRFKKGRSPNSKGRPKGRPNFANVVRDVFNAKTKVQVGAQTLYMSTAEAILRKLTVDASRGNYRSLCALLDIIDMTGRTKDVSDEERARRTMKLPRSLTRPEYDLIMSPARTKDRHRLLLKYQEAEAKGHAPEGDTDRIPESDGSLRSYAADLRARYGFGITLHEPGPVAVRLGLEAEQCLYSGDFAGAIRLADEAISNAPECDVTWMRLIGAHARMFFGRPAEARGYYLSFKSEKNVTLTSWETVILQDFAKLKQAGRSHPLMAEIEKILTGHGWSVAGGAAIKPKAPIVTPMDREFMIMNPDDLKTGELLERAGEVDKAADLYRRVIAKCRASLDSNKAGGDTNELFDLATGRLVLLCRQLLFAGRFAQAFEITGELLAIMPDLIMLQALRAQALMFLGRGNEANAIFLSHRGRCYGSGTWEAAILKDFEAHREAGRRHALMDEIEPLFGKRVEAAPNQEPQPATIADADLQLTEADDVPSGNKLLEQGRFDEALTVYLRNLERWNRRIPGRPPNMRAVDDRDIAVDAVSELVLALVQNREFKTARNAIDQALVAKPHAARASICLAHILMLTGKIDEARTLYLKCAPERLDAKRSGASVMLRDFAAIREAGLTHDLMDEVEKVISGPEKNRRV